MYKCFVFSYTLCTGQFSAYIMAENYCAWNNFKVKLTLNQTRDVPDPRSTFLLTGARLSNAEIEGMAVFPLMLMTSLALCSCFRKDILLQLQPLHLEIPRRKSWKHFPFTALLKAFRIGLMYHGDGPQRKQRYRRMPLLGNHESAGYFTLFILQNALCYYYEILICWRQRRGRPLVERWPAFHIPDVLPSSESS